MNIVYMGTPEFAVGALENIIKAGHNVVACFTQPDKPKGRSGKLVPSPVKEVAVACGIPVYQPVKLREGDNADIIKGFNPDAIVVAAYGQILPESILNIPKYGCINIHASLLPKYRGASPIETAIINGETETGVTTMYMAKGLDTGDMIEKAVVDIAPSDTGETLRARLTDVGAELIVSTLAKLEAGIAVRIPQDDAQSSYAHMLTKDMGELDFTKDANELNNLIRGLQPWPVASTVINGKKVKIYEANVMEDNGGFAPGVISSVTKKTFAISCGSGALAIKRLQPEGKKPMDAASFMNGLRDDKLEVGKCI